MVLSLFGSTLTTKYHVNVKLHNNFCALALFTLSRLHHGNDSLFRLFPGKEGSGNLGVRFIRCKYALRKDDSRALNSGVVTSGGLKYHAQQW